MSQNRSTSRGYTVAELLSVIAALGLIMSSIALILGPLLRSQGKTQAKVDTVQTGTMALYRMERDLRNSKVEGVWVCTTGATPACTAPAGTLTATQAIVLTTAYLNGTGQFQLISSSGAPNWQGATVYWVDAAGNLNVAFDQPLGYVTGTTLSSTQAAQAVTDVLATGGMRIAAFVNQLSVGVPSNPSEHKVSLQLQAQSTIGNASNETTYTTDLETRN